MAEYGVPYLAGIYAANARLSVVFRKQGRRIPGRLRLLRLYVWRYLEELERCEQAMTPQQRAVQASMLMREWP